MWRCSNGLELSRSDDAVPVMATDSPRMYRFDYPFGSLNTDLHGEVYCEAVINSDPVVRNNNSITLDVTGKIYYRSGVFC